MRIGYLGPEGTFTQEALLGSIRGATDEDGALSAGVSTPYPTVYDTVMAVHSRSVDRALVPIENSLEGSVNATLDTLAIEAHDVAIVGELVHPIRHCLIARTPLELSEIEVVVSHPQATAQCAHFIREQLPQATVLAGRSTAEAVRLVAERPEPWAALGPRLAAERYRCHVLRSGVEDVQGNQTRFVWLAHADTEDTVLPQSAHAIWKTAIVFWGAGAESPGWLVRCLTELAAREVNLTRIESRPRKQGLGSYMFFADLEGHADETRVRDGLAALRRHVDVLRILGSFPVVA